MPPTTRAGDKTNKAARNIQRFARRFLNKEQTTKKMPSIIINPFDAQIDLTTKEGRKLFDEGTKGLQDELKLTGDKENLMILEN